MNQQITEELFFTGLDRNLQGRLWMPSDGQVRGCVVMVHGLGEHGQRYRPLAADLNLAGWAALTADLPGHGQSPGRRGHIPSYRRMLVEVSTFLQTAADRFAGLPLVLFGHSMGGNLAANYILRRKEVAASAPDPIALVLSGAMFLPQNPPPRPHIFAAWLTGYLLPWWTIRAPVDSSKLTRDQSIVKAIREDPLMHNRLSLYLGTQLLAQGRHALDHAQRIDLPTLVMHGEADPITSYRASESFALRAGDEARFVSFPEMLHEIFHEPDREKVVDIMVQWMDHLLVRRTEDLLEKASE
jgi:alpha-beta hydrolase superfamily lysophospholipase